MNEKNKIETKTQMQLQEVITYLEELTKGFKEGKVVVQQGEEYLTMLPPDSINVAVEAKQKGKEKFSLELSWVPAASSEESESKITISQKEPETTTSSGESGTEATEEKKEASTSSASSESPATSQTGSKTQTSQSKPQTGKKGGASKPTT